MNMSTTTEMVTGTLAVSPLLSAAPFGSILLS
jgi:hypothetical protein